jgi:hypothetical protein
MNHKDIVVVVGLAVSSTIFTHRLDDDDFATINYPSEDCGSFNKNTIQRTKNLFNDRLLSKELTAPRTLANSSPYDVIMAGQPKG